MADRNLSDDMVKLVEYSIVTIQREHERLLTRGEKIVTDNMTGEAFASWMIAEYLQSRDYKEKVEKDKERWKIKHEEKKYLRVYYNVLDRWPEQDLEYEEKQLKVLKGIEDAILKKEN